MAASSGRWRIKCVMPGCGEKVGKFDAYCSNACDTMDSGRKYSMAEGLYYSNGSYFALEDGQSPPEGLYAFDDAGSSPVFPCRHAQALVLPTPNATAKEIFPKRKEGTTLTQMYKIAAQKVGDDGQNSKRVLRELRDVDDDIDVVSDEVEKADSRDGNANSVEDEWLDCMLATAGGTRRSSKPKGGSKGSNKPSLTLIPIFPRPKPTQATKQTSMLNFSTKNTKIKN